MKKNRVERAEEALAHMGSSVSLALPLAKSQEEINKAFGLKNDVCMLVMWILV